MLGENHALIQLEKQLVHVKRVMYGTNKRKHALLIQCLNYHVQKSLINPRLATWYRRRIAFLLSVLAHRFTNQPSHNAFFKSGLAVLLGNAQVGIGGACWFVLGFENKPLLESYRLRWLTNLRALSNFAVRLNERNDLFTSGHLCFIRCQ